MEVSDIIFYGNAYIWEPDGYMPTGEGTEGRTAFFFFLTMQTRVKNYWFVDRFLTSNIRRVLNVIFFLLGGSLESEFYMLTFRNTLSVPSSRAM